MTEEMTAPPSAVTTRISADCPDETAQILRAAAAHDTALLKKLLNEPEKARSQDPVTGETPLHAAIRNAATVDEDNDSNKEEAAKAAVTELFWSGAIWNEVDDADETPGCVALRLGLKDLYALCRDAGVRAEMLFALMDGDGYEELSSGAASEIGAANVVEGLERVNGATQQEAPGQDANDSAAPEDGDDAPQLVNTAPDTAAAAVFAADLDLDLDSETYLRSRLTYSNGKLVDEQGNGVMMAWETDIMRRSVDALLPGLPSGKRILNIGFGMGIVDTMFAETRPSRHHIIEAHPEVLAHVAASDASSPSGFGPSWEDRGPNLGAFKMHHGKWQDILPRLIDEGEVYDVIYFDTFGEDYAQLRKFFTEYVPGLLDSEGRFGFFNGLGADRQICYDVYTKVVEMHLADAGLDVDWAEVDVDMQRLDEAGRGEWEGVKRRYWTLDQYRLPVCTFLG